MRATPAGPAPIAPPGLASAETGQAAALTDAEPLYTSQSLDVLKAGRQVDGSKAQRELGYKPRPMVETVADIYRWFAAHGDLPAAASGGMPSSGEAGPGS